MSTGTGGMKDGGEMDRSPPIAFFLSAESFIQTAVHAHEALDARDLRLRFEMPVYYLYSHAMELTLKGFLRAKGMTATEVKSRKLGHNLLVIWEACIARGLTLNPLARAIIADVLRLLDPYATAYEFRYVQTGHKVLPVLDEVRRAAEMLHAAVGPTCKATVQGPIPDRG